MSDVSRSSNDYTGAPTSIVSLATLSENILHTLQQIRDAAWKSRSRKSFRSVLQSSAESADQLLLSMYSGVQCSGRYHEPVQISRIYPSGSIIAMPSIRAHGLCQCSNQSQLAHYHHIVMPTILVSVLDGDGGELFVHDPHGKTFIYVADSNCRVVEPSCTLVHSRLSVPFR